MLDCQESGHWWPVEERLGGNWYNGELTSGQKCLVRKQVCQRGCGRVRITKISKRTFEALARTQYAWEEGTTLRTGFRSKYKADMRKEQVRARG